MQADVDMMQSYVSKYGDSVMTSVLHLKEALVFLTEKPEIILQAVFVDVLKRHKGKARKNTQNHQHKFPRVSASVIRHVQLIF